MCGGGGTPTLVPTTTEEPESSTECEVGEVADCSDETVCQLMYWVGDGFCDDENMEYGADLSCYEGEAADCE